MNYENDGYFVGDSEALLPALAREDCAARKIILTDPPYDFDDDTKVRFHCLFNDVVGYNGLKVIFCPPENQWNVRPVHGGADPPQILFWNKPISTKNTKKSYSRFVEMIYIYGNSGIWNSGRNWANYVNVFTDPINDSMYHPHQKPLSLIMRLILNHTDPNDIIIDPFGGSGTTFIAARLLGRRVIAIEQDVEAWEKAKTRIACWGLLKGVRNA